MKPMFVRGFNNYDVLAASKEASTINDEPTMTQQHFKDECDINSIVERFGLTGELPSDIKAPVYGDFTGVTDFRSALHQVMAAEDAFMQMPAKVRSRFDNDPALFVDFCSDPRNREEAESLGLLVPKASTPPASPPKAEGTQAQPGGQPTAS